VAGILRLGATGRIRGPDRDDGQTQGAHPDEHLAALQASLLAPDEVAALTAGHRAVNGVLACGSSGGAAQAVSWRDGRPPTGLDDLPRPWTIQCPPACAVINLAAMGLARATRVQVADLWHVQVNRIGDLALPGPTG
jgi:hypothetical protein